MGLGDRTDWRVRVGSAGVSGCEVDCGEECEWVEVEREHEWDGRSEAPGVCGV